MIIGKVKIVLAAALVLSTAGAGAGVFLHAPGKVQQVVAATPVDLVKDGVPKAEDRRERPTAEDIQKAHDLVKKQVDAIERDNKVTVFKDEELLQLFPGYLLVDARTWVPTKPVGYYRYQLYAVARNGKLEQLGGQGNGREKLEKFFQNTLRPVKDEATAKQAVDAWVRLAADFQGDGYFRFAAVKEATKSEADKSGWKATGKFVVQSGGKGEALVALRFDETGKLTKVEEDIRIQAFARPKCQATKLLDPNPTMRRLAEHDLLSMGVDVQEYVTQQRAKARPELQQAIDRVWQRVQAGEAPSGPRYYGQAALLADKDDLVRRIVEQNLLLMGRAALPHLQAEQDKAGPELSQAIDRLRQRIVAEQRK